MPHFICFLNWTDEGAKNAKDIAKRRDAAESLAASVGGKVVNAYVTSGQYDVVATLDMPDGDAMAKFALGIGSRGQARTTTARAYTHEEITKLASEIP